MACGLLLLGTMSGCFVFTSPPNPDGGTGRNQRPVIVTDLTTPSFGPVGPFQADYLIDFNVYAEDPNLGDALTARLFKLISGAASDMGASTTLEYTGIEFALTFPTLPDNNNPTRRFGQPMTPLACGVIGAPHATTEVYLIVADRPFSQAPPDKVIPGGLSDQNHWELSCL